MTKTICKEKKEVKIFLCCHFDVNGHFMSTGNGNQIPAINIPPSVFSAHLVQAGSGNHFFFGDKQL